MSDFSPGTGDPAGPGNVAGGGPPVGLFLVVLIIGVVAGMVLFGSGTSGEGTGGVVATPLPSVEPAAPEVAIEESMPVGEPILAPVDAPDDRPQSEQLRFLDLQERPVAPAVGACLSLREGETLWTGPAPVRWVVPCAGPHDAEITALATSPDGSLDTSVTRQIAFDACFDQFDGNGPITTDDGSIRVWGVDAGAAASIADEQGHLTWLGYFTFRRFEAIFGPGGLVVCTQAELAA